MTPAKGLQIPERDSAPVVDDHAEDPAVVAGREAQEAEAAFNALSISTPADEETPEFKAAEKRMGDADEAFADAPITTAAGALAKMREIVALDANPDRRDPIVLAPRHFDTVLAFLEAFTNAPAIVGDDPAVAAFAELKAAWAAFDGLGDEEPGHGVNGDPRHAAAYKRYAEARDPVRDAVPVSLAGVAAKVRALLEPYRADADAVGLDHDYDIAAKSMLPFLEGAPAPAPKPDPVVVLFAEWGGLQDETAALGDAPLKGADSLEKQRDELYDRQSEIERQIIDTPATSVGGIAVKLRLLAYIEFPMKGLPDLHRTPAKDTDFKGMIEAFRDDSGLGWQDDLLIGSLRDAERLAGV